MPGKDPSMKRHRELAKSVKLQDDYLSVTDEKPKVQIDSSTKSRSYLASCEALFPSPQASLEASPAQLLCCGKLVSQSEQASRACPVSTPSTLYQSGSTALALFPMLTLCWPQILGSHLVLPIMDSMSEASHPCLS